MRRAAGLAAVGLVAAACGGGSGSPAPPTVAPAKEYSLDWAGPKAVAKPGKTTLRLAVRTPDGKILTRFRTGGGPHTGVHVIIVRDDLSSIIHKHPPVPASGRLALPVTLPEAGRYHVLVDVYPAADSGRPNFQLTHDLQVGSGIPRRRCPPIAGRQDRRADVPRRQAADPEARGAGVDGRRRHGRTGQAREVHAVLRRARTCDLLPRRYARLLPLPHLRQRSGLRRRLRLGGHDGRSTRPGRLELGVLLPATGTWQLFLQVRTAAAADRSVYAAGAMRRREHCAGLLLASSSCSSAGGRWPTRPRRRRSRASSAARASPWSRPLRWPSGRCCRSACSGSPPSASASVTPSRQRPGALPALLVRFGLDSALLSAARWSRSEPSRPGSTRAPGCTCTGGSASRAPSSQCGAHPARALAHGGRRARGPAHPGVGPARRRRPAAAAAAARRGTSASPRLPPHRGTRLAARARPARAWPTRSLPSVATPREERPMNRTRKCRASARAGALVAALALAPSAFAHAHLYPDEMPSGHRSLLQLVVPKEKEDADTTQIVMTVPSRLRLGSVVACPAGPGRTARVRRPVPEGDLEGRARRRANRSPQFTGSAKEGGDYTFQVSQTYSDGWVVNWAGNGDRRGPAP